MVLDSCKYTENIVLILDIYIGLIKVLAKIVADRPGVDDSNVNNISIDRVRVSNVADCGGLVGEIGIKVRDF